MGSDNSIPNSSHEITTSENLLHDLQVFNWALSQPHFQNEFILCLKINLITNISSFIHRKLWFLFKKSLKFALIDRKVRFLLILNSNVFLKKGKKDVFLRNLSLPEFYEFYDMIENYDVLITGKAWGTIDVNQVITSKIRESTMIKSPQMKEKSQELGNEDYKTVLEMNAEKQANKEKEKTPPEDDICVICFDKKIQMILNNCLHGYCEECCQKWIIDKSKNECPLCRALVANTRSKLYKQVIMKEDKQDVKALLKDNIISFIAKIN